MGKIDPTKDYKIIDWRLYDPVNSIFKSKANEKSSFTKVFCNNSENCELFKVGTCVLADFLGGSCEYGYKRTTEGYSRRARKYSSFISESREHVKGIKQLSSTTKKMCRVGDKVFFPYTHWSLDNKNIPENLRTSLFGTPKMIPFDIFEDPIFLHYVLSHRPRALMGGEITEYQRDVVKMIRQHLVEVFPKTYDSLVKMYPEYKVEEKIVIGRKALVNTLKKGCSIELKNYGMYLWDGEKLHSNDFKTSFFPLNGTFEVKFKPNKDASVVITSEDQVDENTKFVD